ncbi:MAG TPA: hypothetical protein VGO86_01085 [Candidatus Dormibacteraeota bacterium]
MSASGDQTGGGGRGAGRVLGSQVRWISTRAAAGDSGPSEAAGAREGTAGDLLDRSRLLITSRRDGGASAGKQVLSASAVRDIVGPGAVAEPLVAALAALTVLASLLASLRRRTR